MKNFESKIYILNTEYAVVVCWGSEEFVKKVAEKYHYEEGTVHPPADDERGICYRGAENHPLIILRKPPRTAEYIAVLAHEAVHAIKHIWRLVGEDMEESEEIFAHSVQAVVGIALRMYRKK